MPAVPRVYVGADGNADAASHTDPVPVARPEEIDWNPSDRMNVADEFGLDAFGRTVVAEKFEGVKTDVH